MGFFSSIKRLWSSNKPAETQETPQAPAEEVLLIRSQRKRKAAHLTKNLPLLTRHNLL